MDHAERFSRLFRRSLIAMAICAVLVTLCYFFIDRPVAFYVHDQDLARYEFLDESLKQITFAPPWVQNWAPLVLVVLIVRRAVGPFRRCELVLLAAAVSIILAEQFKDSMAYLFGRYWPNTWVDNNPSLIRDGAYGFHPFHSALAFRSFPSGHTARTVAFVTPFWLAWPWCRPLCVAAVAAIAMALLGMNYHFVGDEVAGGFVGGLIGVYVAYFLEGMSAPPIGRPSCHPGDQSESPGGGRGGSS